jgi:hypothetical protein
MFCRQCEGFKATADIVFNEHNVEILFPSRLWIRDDQCPMLVPGRRFVKDIFVGADGIDIRHEARVKREIGQCMCSLDFSRRCSQGDSGREGSNTVRDSGETMMEWAERTSEARLRTGTNTNTVQTTNQPTGPSFSGEDSVLVYTKGGFKSASNHILRHTLIDGKSVTKISKFQLNQRQSRVSQLRRAPQSIYGKIQRKHGDIE